MEFKLCLGLKTGILALLLVDLRVVVTVVVMVVMVVMVGATLGLLVVSGARSVLT